MFASFYLVSRFYDSISFRATTLSMHRNMARQSVKILLLRSCDYKLILFYMAKYRPLICFPHGERASDIVAAAATFTITTTNRSASSPSQSLKCGRIEGTLAICRENLHAHAYSRFCIVRREAQQTKEAIKKRKHLRG